MRPRTLLPFHVRWVAVLVIGSLLYAAVFTTLLRTQDVLYVPSLVLIGAAVVPVTFTTFVSGLRGRGGLSFAQLAVGASLGGVIGTVVAGALEFETIRTLGSLPTLGIGVIEESAKLAVPVAILAWRRPRPLDGLVLGVAVGSGFAALETMGYAFVALVQSGGHLGSVNQLLLVRSLASSGWSRGMDRVGLRRAVRHPRQPKALVGVGAFPRRLRRRGRPACDLGQPGNRSWILRCRGRELHPADDGDLVPSPP